MSLIFNVNLVDGKLLFVPFRAVCSKDKALAGY